MARQNCRQISGRVFIISAHFVYQSIDRDFAHVLCSRPTCKTQVRTYAVWNTCLMVGKLLSLKPLI